MDFTFKKKVTKVSCTGYVKKVPHCYKCSLWSDKSSLLKLKKCPIVTKVPYERDKSSLSMLQKFPINVTKVPHVTEVPFFRDKSALFSLQKCRFLWLSLSLSLSLSPSLSLPLPLSLSLSCPEVELEWRRLAITFSHKISCKSLKIVPLDWWSLKYWGMVAVSHKSG